MANIQNPAPRPTYNTFNRQRAIKLRQQAVDLDNQDDFSGTGYYHEKALVLLKQALVLEQFNSADFGVTKKNAEVLNKTPEQQMPNCYDDIQFEPDENESPENQLMDAMETVLKFGKHRGKTMRELVQKKEGRSYLTWLSKTDDEDGKWSYTKQKCRIVLEFAEKAMKK